MAAALDLLDPVITAMIHDAQTVGEPQRSRTLRNLNTVALQLWDAIQVLLEAQMTIPPSAARPCLA